MEGVCVGIRLSILPDVHELPWGERCNWMVSAEESENLCLVCRFNQSIPDLSVPGIAVYGNGWKAQSGSWPTR